MDGTKLDAVKRFIMNSSLIDKVKVTYKCYSLKLHQTSNDHYIDRMHTFAGTVSAGLEHIADKMMSWSLTASSPVNEFLVDKKLLQYLISFILTLINFPPGLEDDCVGSKKIFAPFRAHCGVALSRSLRIWIIVEISRLGRPFLSCNAGLRVPEKVPE